MTSLKKRLVSLLIVISVMFSYASGVSAASDKHAKIEAFVDRCYTVVLGRSSDPSGKAFYVKNIEAGTQTGIEVAYSFFFCNEYRNKDKTNSQYVTDLYKVFFNRQPDTSGFNFWVSSLDSGSADIVPFNGLATSKEYKTICDSYGIAQGSAISSKECARKSVAIALLVDRMYQVILGRNADSSGKTYWVNQLKSGRQTGIQLAYNFVFSSEYKAKNKTDEAFVRDMYNAFFGRQADSSGLNSWKTSIANGSTDLAVFNSFATSAEFKKVCSNSCINPGIAISGVDYARNKSETRSIRVTLANGSTMTVTGYFDYKCETEIYNQLNSYRSSLGKRQLTTNPSMATTAHTRAREIVGYFSHTRPSGSSCFTAFPGVYGYKGENIAAGQSGATSVMTTWKNSEGHNRNMINNNYSAVGIGVFVVTSGNTTYGRYYVQCFGG